MFFSAQRKCAKLIGQDSGPIRNKWAQAASSSSQAQTKIIVELFPEGNSVCRGGETKETAISEWKYAGTSVRTQHNNKGTCI